MELLQELIHKQEEQGYLDERALHELAKQRGVPFYEIQGLVSFYPFFRTTPPPRKIVRVCRDICCAMQGSIEEGSAAADKLANHEDVEVEWVSCLGRCDTAPVVTVNERLVSAETATDLSALLAVVEAEETVASEVSATQPVLTWNCDPYSRAADRYGTLRELLFGSEDLATVCVERLTASGLRGRGGAGFPMGRKWELVASEDSTVKYVICNADESEPGTFKDREILRHLPHLVIEGMVLAGLTVGARQGIVYLRHEYEPEREILACTFRGLWS